MFTLNVFGDLGQHAVGRPQRPGLLVEAGSERFGWWPATIRAFVATAK
jgi:hypothetical protein